MMATRRIERAHDGSIEPITDHEFGLFQAWIHREAGIFLSDAKRALLMSRLAPRLRSLGYARLGAYYRHVLTHPDEGTALLDAITTNETQFFREPRQFEWLERDLLPEWRRSARRGEHARSFRVWCAACSTGEEPYSVAMSMLDAFADMPDASLSILASDVSTRALARAIDGIYPMERATQIPAAFRKRYMLRGTGARAGTMAVGARLRERVQFAHVNLHAASWPVHGRFDLILCRNALIYFGAAARQRVIERLLERLEVGGHLLLGQAETLQSSTFAVRAVAPSVYRRIDAPSDAPQGER